MAVERWLDPLHACIKGQNRTRFLPMSKSNKISRRQALSGSGLIVTAALTGSTAAAAEAVSASARAETKMSAPFVFCLNTSTIRGQKLGIVKEIEVAAEAGFQAIEPWVGTIEEYTKAGGSLKDLKKKIADLGLTVESAIGFPEWIVDDEIGRGKGVEEAKRGVGLGGVVGG